MRKILSLLKACLSTDMNLFRIKQKKNNKKRGLAFPIFFSIFFMFIIWSYYNMAFMIASEKHLENVILSIVFFLISLLTIIEGIYKSGPILFNAKDDDLLLSLPIKRSTILFIRLFKFYLFEFLYNGLFLLPLIIAYPMWVKVDYTFFITSAVMIIMLPIIPIVISAIFGSIITSISSRFKFKNLIQIIVTMIFLIFVLAISMNMNRGLDFIINHAEKINDIISKIYYPAGLYSKLAINFNLMDLLIFIIINLVILLITIFILSKVYFKINSRLKKVTSNKKIDISNMKIKSSTQTRSLIKKELNIFFKTPVFIINAGFALVLFIIFTVVAVLKFDSILPAFQKSSYGDLPLDLIFNNKPLLILELIIATSFMTSITNSVISLEGKNINLLKSLPIKTKTILMSKVYAALTITTPVLVLGDIILFIKFKIGIIECILLLILSILLPLVSHFIGIITNLKYPKLDAENSAEVVKQSTSSLVSVMLGMVLLLISVFVSALLSIKLNPLIALLIFTIIYLLVDYFLYLYLIKKGSKKFNELSI